MATWWTRPSQRRLFSSVSIDEDNHGRWMSSVVLSGSKVHLLGYVRSLWQFMDMGTKYTMQDLARDSGEYLSALHNLRSLTLVNTMIEHISEDQLHTCFSAFRQTLTSLFLDTFATSLSAFVTLIDHFPNIATLRIDWLEVEPDEGPVPSLSRPLRGKLHLHDVQDDCLEFFNRFDKLDLEYEELVIGYSPSTLAEEPLEHALQMGAGTVKILRLTDELQRE